MQATTAAALERLTTAIAGRSLQGYTPVVAGDVLAVAATIAEGQQTKAVIVLVAGAKNNPENLLILQKTDALAELVALAKG